MSHISGLETKPTLGFKQAGTRIASEFTHPVVTPDYYYSQPYSTVFINALYAEDKGAKSPIGTVQKCVLRQRCN